MIKIQLPFLALMLLLNCQDGPKAAFNEEFVKASPNKELPFENLIGEYHLDVDSKIRYNINSTDTLRLIVKKDSTFVALNYVDYKTDSLQLKKFEGKLLYTNKFKESFLNFRSKGIDFNGGGGIEIYYRKKDSIIVLYVYTPPLKGQENGDYLRYIKMKD